jgi:hypothetical protein
MTPQRVAVQWIDGEAPTAPFAHVARPASETPIGGVLLLHEAFGLNADIQAMAGRLAERGYAVLAPDLYRRGSDRLAGYDERAKAIAMLKTLPTVRCWTISSAVNLPHRETGGGPSGVVGLRIGGRYALLAAARGGRIRAAVAYYSAGIDGGTISPLWTLNASSRSRACARRCCCSSSATIPPCRRPRWIRSTPLRGLPPRSHPLPVTEARIRVPRPRHLSRGRGRGCLESAARIPAAQSGKRRAPRSLTGSGATE